MESIRSAAVSSQVVGTLRVRGAVAGGKSGLSSTSLRRGRSMGIKTRVGGCLVAVVAPSSCRVFFQVQATPAGPLPGHLDKPR